MENYVLEAPNDNYTITTRGKVLDSLSGMPVIPTWSPENHQIIVNLNGTSYSLAYLVLQTFDYMDRPQFDDWEFDDIFRVQFLNGNQADLRIENLCWKMGSRHHDTEWKMALVTNREITMDTLFYRNVTKFEQEYPGINIFRK